MVVTICCSPIRHGDLFIFYISFIQSLQYFQYIPSGTGIPFPDRFLPFCLCSTCTGTGQLVGCFDFVGTSFILLVHRCTCWYMLLWSLTYMEGVVASFCTSFAAHLQAVHFWYMVGCRILIFLLYMGVQVQSGSIKCFCCVDLIFLRSGVFIIFSSSGRAGWFLPVLFFSSSVFVVGCCTCGYLVIGT